MAASWIHSTNYLRTRDTSLHPWRHPCTSVLAVKGISLCTSLPLLNIGRDDQHARNRLRHYEIDILSLYYMHLL